MESLRHRTHQLPYFNHCEVFEHCTRFRPGLLQTSDIREVLAEHGFYATERELQGFMYRMDRDLDGYISLQDFLSELTPKLP